jgi:hypothetical protein
MEHKGAYIDAGGWEPHGRSTLDPPLQPIDYIVKELDRMAADVAALKNAIADVAVESEAAVALLEQQQRELTAKDEKIASLEAGGTTEDLPEAEAAELTTSAGTSAANLKAAVEGAPAAPVS